MQRLPPMGLLVSWVGRCFFVDGGDSCWGGGSGFPAGEGGVFGAMGFQGDWVGRCALWFWGGFWPGREWDAWCDGGSGENWGGLGEGIWCGWMWMGRLRGDSGALGSNAAAPAVNEVVVCAV